MVFNDFIKNDFTPEGDGQVASGSVALPDPVPLETEEQRLESEQNERDVLDLLLEKQQSVAGQLAAKYKSETYSWTKKLNKEDYGVQVDEYWVLLAFEKQYTLIRIRVLSAVVQ